MNLKHFIGDRAFYKKVLFVAIPIMIQSGITNFVNLLDNIMVGRIGTEQMSGVAIVNQLLFVFNLTIFGAVSGAGIFGAQFFGSKDYKGVRDSMRFKLVMTGIIIVLAGGILIVFDEPLIGLYLHETGEAKNADLILTYGKEYLKIMLAGLLPFALVQVYAGTLRESGETIVPMKAGVIAVIINLVGNFLLIFGNWGFPQLGVTGAAVATVLSRYVECGIVVIWAHCHSKRHPYMKGLYRQFSIPKTLFWKIVKKGSPLMVNEVLWSMAIATLAQCYSLRGLEVVAAVNITNTLVNMGNVAYLALGQSVGIIVGHLLGAGKMEEAKEADNKLIVFSVMVCVGCGIGMMLISSFFPQLYATEEIVRSLATRLICVSAVCMPMQAYTHAAYFTLRAGGKTGITFLFDSGVLWSVVIPVVFCLGHFTQIPIIPLYFVGQVSEGIKVILGAYFIRKGSWLTRFVEGQ